MDTIPNVYGFGDVIPHLFTDKREIWHGVIRSPYQVSHLSMQRSPLRGKKKHFVSLSKGNTGMLLSELRIGRTG